MKLLSTLYFLLLFSFFSSAQTVGSKVSFNAVDGKSYSGTVTQIQGNRYKISYDGYDYEAWLTSDQFRVVTNTQTVLVKTTGASVPATELQNIFDFGKSKGWATVLQEKKFSDYMARLSGADKTNLLTFLDQAKTSSAKFFVLKSLLNGDDFTILQTFINELNQYSETYQQEHCLITNHRSIIQQWEYSCSVTVVQTFLGDLCPRFAWDVKKISDFDRVANDPYSNQMGLQQKQLLEKYGGASSVRGDYSGKYIAINDALNDFVGKILGVHFSTVQVTESLPAVFGKIRNQLDKGFNVPLLIGFVGSTARHFILVMKYRYVQGGYQYLIYDPWDGVCDYVNESSILEGSFSPLLTSWKISVDYYYMTD
jgi:hypothetical protein